MRTPLKAAVAILPFAIAFLVLRRCAGNDAERWRARVAEVDPAAGIVLDEDDLLVIAPGPEWAAAGRAAGELRRSLVRDFGDLLGRGREQRMVVVVFSSGADLRAHAARSTLFGGGWVQNLHGYTDAAQGAIFLPPDSDLATLRHETVHWVVATSHGGLVKHSPWLSEGLAQLFEPYVPGVTPPGITAGDRAAVARRLPDGNLDIDRLVSIEDYAEFVGEQSARNYLEALVLTAFLFEKRPRTRFARYIDAERQQPEGRAQLFRTVYSPDEPAFRRDLRAYVRALARR